MLRYAISDMIWAQNFITALCENKLIGRLNFNYIFPDGSSLLTRVIFYALKFKFPWAIDILKLLQEPIILSQLDFNKPINIKDYNPLLFIIIAAQEVDYPWLISFIKAILSTKKLNELDLSACNDVQELVY